LAEWAPDSDVPGGASHRFEEHQATGMLSAQLGIPMADAFSWLQAYAFASSRPIAEVARDIVDSRLRLNRDDD
jgi:AmiR/NasT family two-component response regulator